MQDINFFEKVYKVAEMIPYGRVTTYGAIAEFLGQKSSARMVGWAINKSDLNRIPAHRIVNRLGLLTGKQHFGDINIMQQLLENEGIAVSDNKINDFEKFFWDPCKEIDKKLF